MYNIVINQKINTCLLNLVRVVFSVQWKDIVCQDAILKLKSKIKIELGT
jgi:hypothetical protein